MTASPAAAPSRAAADRFAAACALYGPRLMADLDLLEHHAAGILGNAGHESDGLRRLQEMRPVVPGSRGGWGWFQLTGPRRRAMEAWCRAARLDPASDAANYGYLLVELRGPEAAALAALRRAATLEAATERFMRAFERPGVPHLARRVAWARRALAALRPRTDPEPAGHAAHPEP
ncbi:phage tail tip lysozyme [Methylobacterium sp. NEAU 140]|uniref:phage tail tip lysozyme n=1 Tax=Methylobacterium sp. NEAU 140 TaxID=3064945 RepID=UPI0027363D46|nr:phage tail tip lysozyme [Methylobacterium sp. NEAU 140]MDP4021402.1 phage tail tip lysozyme [Methylobacterium sp. NEAU 140]